MPREVSVTGSYGDAGLSMGMASVGRGFISLGIAAHRVAAMMGVHNAAMNQAISMLLTLGSVVRAAYYAKRMLAMASMEVVAGEVAEEGANTTLAASNLGLAASFQTLFAAMGPVGWAMIGIAAVAGIAGGYALAGGFGHGAAGGPIGPMTTGMPSGGAYHEPSVQVNVNVDKLTTKQDVQDTFQQAGTILYREMRKYRS